MLPPSAVSSQSASSLSAACVFKATFFGLFFCSAEPGSGPTSLNGRSELEPTTAAPGEETVTRGDAVAATSAFQDGDQQGASAASRDQVLPRHVPVRL